MSSIALRWSLPISNGAPRVDTMAIHSPSSHSRERAIADLFNRSVLETDTVMAVVYHTGILYVRVDRLRYVVYFASLYMLTWMGKGRHVCF